MLSKTLNIDLAADSAVGLVKRFYGAPLDIYHRESIIHCHVKIQSRKSKLWSRKFYSKTTILAMSSKKVKLKVSKYLKN